MPLRYPKCIPHEKLCAYIRTPHHATKHLHVKEMSLNDIRYDGIDLRRNDTCNVIQVENHNDAVAILLPSDAFSVSTSGTLSFAPTPASLCSVWVSCLVSSLSQCGDNGDGVSEEQFSRFHM